MIPNRFTNNLSFFRATVLFLLTFWSTMGFGQGALPEIEVTDLNLSFTLPPPNNVNAGGVISAQILVSLVANPDNPFAVEKIRNVPNGETVTAVVELRDRNGVLINSHTQTYAGFSNNTINRSLDNSPGGSERQVSFQIPWTEAEKKLNENDRWTLTAYVTGSSTETRVANNILRHSFSLNLPNLKIVGPPTLQSTSNPIFLPNSDVIATAVIENNGTVQTEPGSFFNVTAVLRDQSGIIVDRETKILPDSTNGSTATINPGATNQVAVTFPGLRIPADTSDENMSVEINVDREPATATSSAINNNMINEEFPIRDKDNNVTRHFSLPRTVITPILRVIESSFSGEEGRFDGLEPIRISFSVRNEGNRPINSSDTSRIRVVLSLDESYDDMDFILREFNFGGAPGELGFDLLPNENVFLDWVQQLPDNLEGDYYLLASVIDGSNITDYLLNNTPTITLRSKNVSSLKRVVARNNPTERPDASFDGRFVVFEETDANGVKQIWYRDTVVGGQPILVSRNIDSNSTSNLGGNQNSLRPKISGDGRVITFHSRASDLVPNDKNEHSDVFLFKTLNGQVIRALNAGTNQEPNGASLYPDINFDGSKIVFHSTATNLPADGSTTSGQQIFLWDTKIGTYGTISAITAGNNHSREVSIDDVGSTILFSSDATDLDDFGKADNNGRSDVYAHNLATGRTWIVSLNPRTETPGNGVSDQPAISGDGQSFVFRSESTDFVRNRGISSVKVVRGGVGYFGNVKAVVSDDFGAGEGAVLSLENAVDAYGQIMPGKIEIVDPGRDYVTPRVEVVADSPVGIPTVLAEIEAYLSHPEGEVYHAELGNPGEYNVVAGSLKRVSENANGVGGNESSKDPQIDYSGSRIAFSSKASNLLPDSISRPDGTTYLNRPSSMAKAKAVIVGGIGEIEIVSPGRFYNSGFLSIEDSSGRGFGATAEFEVDDMGRISSINVLTPGQDYDLSTTTVTVAVPGGGFGFIAGEIRFVLEEGIGEDRVGGGRIHSIEMVDHGFGYDDVSDLIRIEGDGADLDSDGSPDARIDSTSVYVDSMGSVFLSQTFEIEILSTASLLSTEIYIEDANKSVTIKFDDTSIGTSTVAIGNPADNLDVIRDRLIAKINSNWNNPVSIQFGPQIDQNFTGGTTFTLEALSGKISVNNTSSIRVQRFSNMIFGGGGFTRATPIISPAPAIYGFSEVLSGTNTELSESGRPLYQVMDDRFSDDVYLYQNGTGLNSRISRSKFGFPVNYLAESNTTLPSNRFPAMSGNGRFVYFSSDADGLGSLVFDVSNQLPEDNNRVRDIYHVDLKTTPLTRVDIDVDMLYPSSYADFTFGADSLIPIIAQIDYAGEDIGSVELVVNNIRVARLEHFEPSLNSNRWTTDYTTSSFAGEYVYQIIVYNRNNEQLGASIPRIIKVSDYNSMPPVADLLDFNDTSMSTSSTKRITAQGQDFDGSLVGIQFYVNGTPFGEEILRRPNVSQDLASYITDISSSTAGMLSVFVIARDNSGNHVASRVQTISVTPGDSTPAISLVHGPEQLTLIPSDIILQLDTDGSILSVTLPAPVGKNYLGNTLTEVIGSGINAQLESILDQDTSSLNYGKVTGFSVLKGGTGYDTNTSINILPVVRLVGYGQPAEIDIGRRVDNPPFSAPIYYAKFDLKKDVNGNPKTGYGYAISPRWEIQSSSGSWFTHTDFNTLVNYERLPLVESNFTTGGVAPINDGFGITLTSASPHRGSRLLGGFTQSPCFFEYDVVETGEPLNKVQFFVNGRLTDEKVTPPFAFSFIADDPGEYDIYASAIDKSGNVVTSKANKIDVKRYNGSGVSSGLSLESNYSIAADTKTILTATASSEFGVAEVEFYINEKSYAKVLGDGNLEAFIAEVDLGGLNQGEHALTLVARDFAGNISGTFDPSLTNIESRQDETFSITAKLPSSVPPNIELLYPPVLKRMTINSTIYLQATAIDPDGSLTGVQFYINGQAYGNEIPYDKGLSQEQYPFGIEWSPPAEGVYLINAVARDSSGNRALSASSTVTVTMGDEFVPKLKFVALNSEYEAGESIFLSVEVTDEANSTNGLGVVEEMQFFANGKIINDFNGSAPYFYDWVPAQGIYEVYASAKDNEGNIGLSEVQVVSIGNIATSQPPSIELVYPPSVKRITKTSTIYLFANASDSDDRIEGVQFYINGLPYGDEILFDRSKTQQGFPYGIKWTPPETGVYLINAVARDSSGKKATSTSSTVTVAPGDEFVPTVTFTDLNSFYESSKSIFLSAEAYDEANSSSGIGVVEDVEFFVNGEVFKDFNSTGPFFEVWPPQEPGIYQVYAMVVDNEGNHALSSIQTVLIGSKENFSETPQIGSLNPAIETSPLTISVSRRSGRRTATGVITITSIEGLSPELLENFVVDQIIRFSDGLASTAEYSIAEITVDGVLELHGDMSENDEKILKSASKIELVPIFTVGSRIYISLKPEVEDSGFDAVSFYIDGTELETDTSWPFSTIFLPTDEGNYTVSVVAENQFQNKTLYSERLVVGASRGLVPTGAVSFMPQVVRRFPRAFAVTSGSQISMQVNFEDLDDGISRVEFYMNGQLLKIDYQAPFYHRFSPKSDASPNITDRGFEMVAVGVDYSGNRYSARYQGVINGSTVFPSTTLRAPNNMEEFSNGQSIEVKVEVIGSITPNLLGINSSLEQDLNLNPNIRSIPRSMAIMANGEFVSIARETNWGTGIFVGEWVSDISFASEDGTVELFGTMLAEEQVLAGPFGNTVSYSPTIFSNSVFVKISEPDLAADPQSAINQTFNDFLGVNPSQAEVVNAYNPEMDDGAYLFDNKEYLTWASRISDRDSFQNMVDSIAGYHIMTGQWPLATKVDEILTTYSATPNNNSDGSGDFDGDGFSLLQELRFQTDDQDPTSFPPPAFRIESFIDETLVSDDFTDIHGTIPPLAPPPGFDDRTENYDTNRREFVKTFFKNKYNRYPSPAQEHQGAYRLASFNPNSPEALYEQRQEQLRQIAMYASFGFGGNQGTGGTTQIMIPSPQLVPIDQYQNAGGQQATLFLTNLIAEKLIDNQPMIYGAEDKRNTYQTAALIIALWADNLEALTDDLISNFNSLSTEEKISRLMKDRRYFDRFGGYSISRLATEKYSGGWNWLDWFGLFNDDSFPWIYHENLGWMYVYGQKSEEVWFYLPNAGWLWTSKDIWQGMNDESSFLWLYEQTNSRWVFLILDATLPIDSKENTFMDYDQIPLAGDKEVMKTFWDSKLQKFFLYE